MENIPLLSKPEEPVHSIFKINDRKHIQSLRGTTNATVTHSYNNQSGPWCIHLMSYFNVRRCVSILVIVTLLSILYYTHLMDASPIAK